MNQREETFDDLLIRLCHGAGDGNQDHEQAGRVLEAQLRDNPLQRTRFLQRMHLEADLHLAARTGVPRPETGHRPKVALPWTGFRWWGAAAALFVAAIFISALWQGTRQAKSTPLAESLARNPSETSELGYIGVIVGYEGSSTEWIIGNGVTPGPINLTDGFLDIQLTHNARLTLSGRTSLHLDSPERAFLQAGRLSVDLGTAESEFELETPHLQLRELPQRFAVAVAGTESTAVHAYFGDLEATTASGAHLRLAEAETAVAMSDGRFTLTRDDLGLFAPLDPWPPGIRSIRGRVCVLDRAPASLESGSFHHDYVLVFREKRLANPAAVRVNVDQPGTWFSLGSPSATGPGQGAPASYPANLRDDASVIRPLVAGKTTWPKVDHDGGLTSYLIHYDTRDRTLKNRVLGEITFANPVVAIICQNLELRDSDQAFGWSETRYRNPSRTSPSDGTEVRGLEDDFIELSADRHTLRFDLSQKGTRDQIRVLVGERNAVQAANTPSKAAAIPVSNGPMSF